MPDPPEPKFAEGAQVLNARELNEHGVVVGPPEWDQGWWYRVRFSARSVDLMENELVPVAQQADTVESLARVGQWGLFSAFRRAVAVDRILNQNRSTVYAYRSNRVEFHPHQYRPLLKLLDSEDRRLLIADEVGLGKTIEAGLILAELDARQPLERVLVLCPSRLREKWRNEMFSKFDEEFDIWAKRDLEDLLEKQSRRGSSPRFRAVASLQGMRSEAARDLLSACVPSLDLLIVDEAHHARNSSTSTYGLIEELAVKSETVLLLSATPLHLGSRDLFNLLRLLRQNEFTDRTAFDLSLQRNEGVVFAQRVARARLEPERDEAVECLRHNFSSQLALGFRDPLVDEAVKILQEPGRLSTEKWFEVEDLLERAHVLSSVLTRTKKREVHASASVRRGYWHEVEWTQQEFELCRLLTGVDFQDPKSRYEGGLGGVQRARQAASSLAAAMGYRRTEASDSDGTADEMSDLEWLEDGGQEETAPRPSELLTRDSKLERFLELVRGLLEEDPGRKILVFTFFIGTSHYLRDALEEKGIQAARIAGDVPSDPRNPDRDQRGRAIKRFRDDPGLSVLVSTEVGSEGLDFQFCSCLINYDLPWNPMVVEQRIGRIDRMGQKAEVLHIHSLVVKDTIDSVILKRLYDRINIFERSIGDLETIIGDEIEEIQRNLFSSKLTVEEAEKRSADTARAIEKRIADTERLEKEAVRLAGHEERIQAEVTKVGHLGRYVTRRQYHALLTGFLDHFHASSVLEEREDGSWRLRRDQHLLKDLRQRAAPADEGFDRFLARGQRGYWDLTTVGEQAYDDGHLELLAPHHPLVRAAAQGLEELLREPVARVGSAVVDRSKLGDGAPAPGAYFVAVWSLTISGLKKRRLLQPVVVSVVGDSVATGEDAERLAHMLFEHGEDHPGRAGLGPMPEAAWQQLRSEARRAKRGLEEAEQRLTDSLFEQRRQRVMDEFDRKARAIESRRRTLERNRRSEQMIALASAQLQKAEENRDRKLAQLEADSSVHIELDASPVALCAFEIE